MASQPIPLFTPEEFLVWEHEQEHRHEYFDGEIIAMAGTSYNHLFITGNLSDLLSPPIRRAGCRVLSSDLRVSVIPGTFCYPDLTIACPPFESYPKSTNTLVNPTFVIEVLSPSTRRVDRNLKLPRYRELPSLTGYLLIEQDRVSVEYGSRPPGGEWTVTTYTEPSDRIDLAPFVIVLNVSEIYADVHLTT